jgi:phenylacetic acid degradation protein
MNSVLMDGCVIGENAFIAALSFVRAGFEVPPDMLAAGIPAKVLRELTEEEKRWKKIADEDYQGIIRRSHASLELVEALTEPDGDGPRIRAPGARPLSEFRQR